MHRSLGGRARKAAGVEDVLGVAAPGFPEGLPKGLPAARHNVEQDKTDARLWREVNEGLARLRRLAEEARAPETFPALLRDLWAILYRAAPRLIPEEEVDPAYAGHRPLLERFLVAEETATTRVSTCLDELLSALAAIRAGEALLEAMREEPALAGAGAPVPAGGGAPGGGFDGDADADEPEGGPSDPGGEGGASAVPGRPSSVALRRAARAAAGAAMEEAEVVGAALNGWGLETSDFSRAPIGDRLVMLEKLRSPRMRRLAETVGRMRNLARAGRRERVGREPEEVHAVTVGADLPRVLPQELALLRRPETRGEFYRRLVDRRLLCYELKTTDRKAKGPLVALVDCSGSMSGAKMDWATAVALALVEVACMHQKRPAAVLFFDTRVVQETRFEPDEHDPAKLLEVATVAGTGDTDYRPALDRARDIVREERPFALADVVLVTDALCRLPDAYVEALLEDKRRLNLSLYSVLIGAQVDPWGELGRYSDGVWSARDLRDPSGRSGGRSGGNPGADGAAGAVFRAI